MYEISQAVGGEHWDGGQEGEGEAHREKTENFLSSFSELEIGPLLLCSFLLFSFFMYMQVDFFLHIIAFAFKEISFKCMHNMNNY